MADTIKIGVSITSFDNPFLTIIENRIKDEVAKEGAELIIEDAQLDIARQQNQVQNLIANGVNSIIVNAVNGSASPAMRRMAVKFGIPRVYVNHLHAEHAQMPEGTSFVSSDEVESGTMQTKEICKILSSKVGIYVLMRPLENEASKIRTQDIEDVIARLDAPPDGLAAMKASNLDGTVYQDAKKARRGDAASRRQHNQGREAQGQYLDPLRAGHPDTISKYE